MFEIGSRYSQLLELGLAYKKAYPESWRTRLAAANEGLAYPLEGNMVLNMIREIDAQDKARTSQRVVRYVAGFLFDDQRHVALIRKLAGPSCLLGKLNAIGGKIEPGEHPHEAMAREFAEETGLHVSDWIKVVVLSGPGFEVTFFRAFTTPEFLSEVRTMEKEPVAVYSTDPLPQDVVPNVRWLVPMALTTEASHVSSYEVQEVTA